MDLAFSKHLILTCLLGYWLDINRSEILHICKRYTLALCLLHWVHILHIRYVFQMIWCCARDKNWISLHFLVFFDEKAFKMSYCKSFSSLENKLINCRPYNGHNVTHSRAWLGLSCLYQSVTVKLNVLDHMQMSLKDTEPVTTNRYPVYHVLTTSPDSCNFHSYIVNENIFTTHQG